MSKISIQTNSEELHTSNSSWSNFLQLNPGQITQGGQYMLSLAVGSTWNDTAGSGADFRICVKYPSGTEIVLGQGSVEGNAGQRLAISLNAYVNAKETGIYNFTAAWRTRGEGTSNIAHDDNAPSASLILLNVDGEPPKSVK
jgi:hypothetical protein